jgi:hypothetical protein
MSITIDLDGLESYDFHVTESGIEGHVELSLCNHTRAIADDYGSGDILTFVADRYGMDVIVDYAAEHDDELTTWEAAREYLLDVMDVNDLKQVLDNFPYKDIIAILGGTDRVLKEMDNANIIEYLKYEGQWPGQQKDIASRLRAIANEIDPPPAAERSLT